MLTIIAAMLDPANFAFSVFSIPPLITSAAVLLLGLAVVRRERASSASVSFLVFTSAVALWLFIISWTFSTSSELAALGFQKAVYLGVPFIAPSLYHFTVVILGRYSRRAWLVWLNWLIGVSVSAFVIGTPVVVDSVYHYWFGYYVRFHGPIAVYLIVTFATATFSIAEFANAYLKAAPGTMDRRRAHSFLVALSVGTLGGVDCLPGLGVPIYPFGFIFIALFAFLVGRTVWIYQLFDITPALASRQILETMTDPLIVFDQERIVRLVNSAACVFLGYSESQLTGRPAYQTLAGSLIASRASLAFNGQRIRNEEIRFDPGDGSRSPVTMSLSASLLLDRRERPRAIVCVVRNVTEYVAQEEQIRRQSEELKLAYDTLQRTQEQVIQQERLYALGTMASGIAHDFNNALTPILGYSDLLLRMPTVLDNRTQAIEWIRLINDGATDAAKVIARLRDFYRPAQALDELAIVDIDDLVKQTIALTHPRWHDHALLRGHAIQIETDLQPVQPVDGSATELREALTNLVFNAVDALPEGGTITLRTYATADHTVLEVSDTGVGMTEEVRQRCFEPFFSTKGEHGSGLGLSVVYGSVRRHKGVVVLESAVGKGTTFRISLPVSRRTTLVAEPLGEAAHRQRILLVEDEERVRDIVHRYLLADGHAVEEAVDGDAGLAAFDARRFDLVITDRGMPGLNGDGLAAAIRARAPTMPIIMLTGYGDLMNAASERPPGIDLVLTKPITLETLRSAINEVKREP